jgi:microcystin degradation protein MlrC
VKTTYRIAVGSIFVECNTLVDTRVDISYFERNELRRGKEVLRISAGVVGGMLHTLRERQAEVAPLLVASSVAGGPLTTECYRQLRLELVDYLKAAMPVDGVLLALHGSAIAADIDDVEGDLLRAVRKLVGPSVPVVGTLDCHAHVTEGMIRYADALLAWETYPHMDTYTTGVRGTHMLLDTLDTKVKPAMAMAKVPVLASGINGHTESPGPFAEIMRLAKSLEGREGVISTSVFLVHPYLDLPDLGGGALVIADGDIEKAAAHAQAITARFWERRFDLDPEVFAPAEAIAKAQRIEAGPILLVETADCAGGGAAGDSVATLKALLEAGVSELSLVPVVDPQAAEECHRKGVSQTITLSLGHKLDPKWGTPVEVTGKILTLSDGRFQYSGGIWESGWGDMGPTATIRVGALQVLIMTNSTYDWADEQFRRMGMDTPRAKFIVVKNPMNHRLGYAGIYKERFVLDTPGPTPATLKHIQYRRVQRPFHPLDKDIRDFSPTVLRHSS